VTQGDCVTVVIPARNERAQIETCLQSVLAQDYPHLEVLVVDGASDDGTAQVVAEIGDRDPRVRLVPNPARIIPVGLNLALARASGRWLVRVDAHATIPPGYVSRAVEHLRDGTYAGVGGRKDGVGETTAGRAIAVAMASPFGVGNSVYHYGTRVTEAEHVPFGAYRIDVARALGGWDEKLRVNQDFEFDYRLRKAGHRLLFDPELVIHWQCRQSVRDLYVQYQRYGRGKVRVLRKHPASASARHLVPPALVAELVLASVAALRSRRAAAALALPYAVVLGAATVATASRLGEPAERRYLPAAFAAMHVGWGVGFWQGVADVAQESVRRD
jgi:glycosyltransferase involved in cell wall biosynthesis